MRDPRFRKTERSNVSLNFTMKKSTFSCFSKLPHLTPCSTTTSEIRGKKFGPKTISTSLARGNSFGTNINRTSQTRGSVALDIFLL